jgi:adenylate cyclase
MGKEIEVAILFADVCGSTRIYEVMGDAKAREMVLECLELMRSATERHGGEVIKTIGDEIMATFPTADDAIDAAADMHQDLLASPDLVVENQHVALRIGCHFGSVVSENRDIFGAAVHTANRLTSQAKAGQIMVSAAIIERLGASWRGAIRQIDVATLKGKTSEDELFEVLWQREDATSMVPTLALGQRGERRRSCRATLIHGGHEAVVDGQRTQVTIGRSDENDVVIKGTLISRLHARVELVRNRIMLVDQSTNGTFVVNYGGEETFVRRDSVQLRGEGLIGFGRVPESGSPQTLQFICEE